LDIRLPPQEGTQTVLAGHAQEKTPPAAGREIGINKKIGWHTFRRTYASLLAASGADVKVVQELLRHANVSTTMNLYAQAYSLDARSAQNKVVDMVVRAEQDAALETLDASVSPILR
jgi:integrase